MSKCAEMVYKSQGGWGRRYQCERKAGHGPEGKYCPQHAEQYADGDVTTWYRADCFSDYTCGLAEVQVLKESDSSLLIKGINKPRREAKSSNSYCYFPQRAQAIQFYRDRIQGLKARVEQLEKTVNALADKDS